MKDLFVNIGIMVLFLIPYSHSHGQSVSKKKLSFGQGIQHTAKDSSFSTKFNFRMQHLFLVQYEEASSDFTSQFLIRRARIKFDGYALSPKLDYKVELGLSNRDISINKEDGNTSQAARIILDAVLKWKFSRTWTLWVGQAKLPGNRERVVSSGNLQFVDRSLLNSQANLDRDFGLQLHGKYQIGSMMIIPSFSLTQGEGRSITSSNFGGFSYTGHVDFLPFGAFTNGGDYIESDLDREPIPKLSIGLTYDYNDRAVRQGGQLGFFVTDLEGNYVQNTLKTFFIDLMFKYKGLSILSAFGNKKANDQFAMVSKGFITGRGLNIQAGYLFKNDVEIALRYTSIRKDGDLSGMLDEDQYTFGVSRYIIGHALKVQGDLTRRSVPDFSDGKYQLRMQVEMQF